MLRAPPAGFRAEPRLPKGFPPFSALRMSSPDTDTIILLIVDYHAAMGGDGKTPTPASVLPCPRCDVVSAANHWFSAVLIPFTTLSDAIRLDSMQMFVLASSP